MGRQITIYLVFGIRIPMEPLPTDPNEQNNQYYNHIKYDQTELMNTIQCLAKEDWDKYYKIVHEYSMEEDVTEIDAVFSEIYERNYKQFERDLKITGTPYTIGYYRDPNEEDTCAFIQLKTIKYLTIQLRDKSPKIFDLPTQSSIDTFINFLRDKGISNLDYNQFIVKLDIH